jgi:hypothetical protein
MQTNKPALAAMRLEALERPDRGGMDATFRDQRLIRCFTGSPARLGMDLR